MDLSSPQFNQKDLTIDESVVLFRDWIEELAEGYTDPKNARVQLKIVEGPIIMGSIQ